MKRRGSNSDCFKPNSSSFCCFSLLHWTHKDQWDNSDYWKIWTPIIYGIPLETSKHVAPHTALIPLPFQNPLKYGNGTSSLWEEALTRPESLKHDSSSLSHHWDVKHIYLIMIHVLGYWGLFLFSFTNIYHGNKQPSSLGVVTHILGV